MTDQHTPTTEQIVEAGAKVLWGIEGQHLYRGAPTLDEFIVLHGEKPRPVESVMRRSAAILDAMLPLIRKQLAEEVRRQCFTSEGAKFAIRQGRSVREIQEFNAALEFAASLIEEVER